MQNALAGPSVPAQPPPKKKPPPCPKRKRTDTSDDQGDDSASQPRKGRDGPKKKKANRACFHCQKAHLTCDDSRPCQRCTKRGIASSCTEGFRKKAKYLLDEEELAQLKASGRESLERGKDQDHRVSENLEDRGEDHGADRGTELGIDDRGTEDRGPSDSLGQDLGASFDPEYSFGSEAANLEYSILCAILGNPSSSESVTSLNSPTQASQASPVQTAYSSWPSDQVDYTPYPHVNVQSEPSNPAQYLPYQYSSPQQPDEELTFPQFQSPQPQAPLHPLQPRYPLDTRPRSPPPSTVFDSSLIGSGAFPDITRPQSCGSKLQNIHDRVTSPFDYTEGYHFLMRHLRSRFEKNDILRIVRALAIFRPSLIALQMPLSLEDEVFVEKCFQRTLLELDKLISFSGTPTVVWRRTGEICLVAPEFCMLTEWSMEELVGRKKYIYELFENQSVVEYWESFASHAFENTTQSVYSHCVLLKPSGAPVPATFCFSIRRDLFDLPSMVIGQWLPLL